MAVIKDLKLDDNGLFTDGKFDSVSLFKEEMNLSIFVDDRAIEEDAIRCIEHYNSLLAKPEMCKKFKRD